MTSPATLLKRPDPDPAYTTELAKQHLISLLTYCEEADGDERLHRYHECGDKLDEYSATAGINVTRPKGKPRPITEPEPVEAAADTTDNDDTG